ncbi:protein-disulfide reductase DsbD domain-containing protein [Pedobacter miscanthi]|uniref:Thiol:disulfide interchange protein DsbD N-terminal domain-containing protein n=1 Tax=Pedobacter miscanthi TaxID=2259170 RepID=A0A366L5B7_9SPHI|nr:protein-disulfide reductase DsbD domain-containing protein [Pedobacter miscanthi]RBQ09016.1 hypothetical protein DRW42_07365 [Pedobacter miscanthi]
MKKILTLCLMLVSLFTFGNGKYRDKIALRVLYVGYNPDKPMPKNVVYYSTTPAIIEKIYKTRMADFKAFLELRFTEVKVVDVADYKPDMSDGVDVTLMDAGPVNMPANFNRPMVLMHAMAPNVGLPLGLKFDWYCQCLDDEALNIKTDHPIFNTPNAVKLTMVKKPTPGSFFNGHQAATTPKEMEMWQVVKQGFSSKEPYLIGMVSHGEGFNDSPDAESISGGVCLKNAEAVALGRQGNYFMWGFAGSPDYMTDEAKDVFVNAICYIKKFDHKAAMVKKVQIETRSGIDELVYRLNKDLYNQAIVSRREGNLRMLKMQQELKDKKAKGEDIGHGNEMFLKMPVTNDTQSFEDYVKGFAGDSLFRLYGTNIGHYHKYYRENYEYFYPSGVYTLQLDRDAQKLGISNRKVALLDKCVSLLEHGKDVAMAQRLLERYTTQNFTKAADWRNWLNQNRNNLFYTESGGFKFMVNTYGKTVPLGEQHSYQLPKAVVGGEPTTADPVAVSARFIPGNGNKKDSLVIEAKILKGWHIYAYVSKDNPFIVTETRLELPEGAIADQEWKTTAAIPYPGNEGMFIFEGKANFRLLIDYSQAKAGTKIKCGLYYQVCDETKCYPPKEKMLEISI